MLVKHFSLYIYISNNSNNNKRGNNKMKNHHCNNNRQVEYSPNAVITFSVGSTPLRIACETTHLDVGKSERRAFIRLLLEAGASVDTDLRTNEHVKVKE